MNWPRGLNRNFQFWRMNSGRRGGAETSPNFQPKFYLYFFVLACFYDSADISATRSSGTPWALGLRRFIFMEGVKRRNANEGYRQIFKVDPAIEQ